jgi:flagellar biosynthesis/type III secretory pathway protein FliH
MAKVTLTVPRKLNKVEILSKELIRNRRIKPFIVEHKFQSFDEINNKQVGELFFREDDFIENNETIAINPLEEPEHNYVEFYERRVFCRSEIPVQISTERVPPEDTLPLAEVREEVQHAYDRGFDDAQQLTTNTFENQILKLQERVSNFDYLAVELKEQFNKELDKVAKAIGSISVMVAGHILGREIKSNPDIVIEQVKKAIVSLDKDMIFRIHVHPNNVNLLEDVRITLDYDKSKIENIQIVPDESVDEGGCMLYTSAGTIDSRIRTQLASMEKALSQVSMNLSEKEQGMKEESETEEEDDSL